MKESKIWPKGMLGRWPTMTIWLVALSFTTFDAPEFAATMVAFALVGVGLALGLYLLWGKRTRPAKNAFWFLVHVVLVGGLIAMSGFRPVLGALAAFPVALLWLHDSPASPSSMLTWGVLLVLWQPEYWSHAEAEVSWDIVVAVILMIGASQFERNRLAARQHTQAGIIFSLARLGAVFVLSLMIVAGREGLRAVNAFTYIGIDASGTAGKLTMLGFVAVSIALAMMLFRVRPEKPRQLSVTSASAPRTRLDFDEAPEKVARKVDKATHVSTRVAKAADANRQRAARTASKPAAKAKVAAKPGELDFD